MAKEQDDGLQDSLPRELGRPARRALVLAGYSSMEALQGVSEAYLTKLHGVGPRGLSRLKNAMAAKGLALSA